MLPYIAAMGYECILLTLDRSGQRSQAKYDFKLQNLLKHLPSPTYSVLK